MEFGLDIKEMGHHCVFLSVLGRSGIVDGGQRRGEVGRQRGKAGRWCKDADMEDGT